VYKPGACLFVSAARVRFLKYFIYALRPKNNNIRRQSLRLSLCTVSLISYYTKFENYVARLTFSYKKRNELLGYYVGYTLRIIAFNVYSVFRYVDF